MSNDSPKAIYFEEFFEWHDNLPQEHQEGQAPVYLRMMYDHPDADEHYVVSTQPIEDSAFHKLQDVAISEYQQSMDEDDYR